MEWQQVATGDGFEVWESVTEIKGEPRTTEDGTVIDAEPVVQYDRRAPKSITAKVLTDVLEEFHGRKVTAISVATATDTSTGGITVRVAGEKEAAS